MKRVEWDKIKEHKSCGVCTNVHTEHDEDPCNMCIGIEDHPNWVYEDSGDCGKCNFIDEPIESVDCKGCFPEGRKNWTPIFDPEPKKICPYIMNGRCHYPYELDPSICKYNCEAKQNPKPKEEPKEWSRDSIEGRLDKLEKAMWGIDPEPESDLYKDVLELIKEKEDLAVENERLQKVIDDSYHCLEYEFPIYDYDYKDFSPFLDEFYDKMEEKLTGIKKTDNSGGCSS